MTMMTTGKNTFKTTPSMGLKDLSSVSMQSKGAHEESPDTLASTSIRASKILCEVKIAFNFECERYKEIRCQLLGNW